MKKGLIGRKLGMTQLFDEKGNVVPVTVIEAGPCVVSQKKTIENDGYEAVQIGYGDMKGGELLTELLYYGVSSISLSTTGSEQQGVRACTSRMRSELYEVMEERMRAFHEDHPL